MQNDLIPQSINDKADLQQVADIFASATAEIRTIESHRKEKTAPLRKVIDDYITAEKSMKAEHEAVVEKCRTALSGWRCRPEIGEHYARLSLLEKKYRTAEQEADVKGMELISGHLAELKSDCPRSLPVEGGSIRFRENLIIDEIDLEVLEPSLTYVAADEKAVKKRIAEVGACNGVKFHYEYGVALYESKDDNDQV